MRYSIRKGAPSLPAAGLVGRLRVDWPIWVMVGLGHVEHMGFSNRRGQKTLKERVCLSGIGVHSGKPVNMTICPSPPDSGISFFRTLGPGSSDIEIPATSASIGATALCTVLGDPAGVCVSTVEHLLAAFMGLGIDNARIEIDGAEVPVMDGSAAHFVHAIDQAGIVAQKLPRRFMRVRKAVRVECGEAFAEFLPYDGARFEIAIDYACAVIGAQAFAFDLTPSRFRKDIAGARTFGHMKDVGGLRASGFAMGSSLDNTIVIDDGAVVNPEGLRFADEFVRHKVLDTIGDLALAGAPLRGLYRSYRGGHKLNALALAELIAQPDAWSIDAAERPARAEPRGDFLAGMLSPAFAPEFS